MPQRWYRPYAQMLNKGLLMQGRPETCGGPRRLIIKCLLKPISFELYDIGQTGQRSFLELWIIFGEMLLHTYLLYRQGYPRFRMILIEILILLKHPLFCHTLSVFNLCLAQASRSFTKAGLISVVEAATFLIARRSRRQKSVYS